MYVIYVCDAGIRTCKHRLTFHVSC